MDNPRANVMVTTYVTPVERECLAAAASLEDRKVSAYVRRAIVEKIDRDAIALHGLIVSDPRYNEGDRPALDALLARLEAVISRMPS